MGSPLQLGAVTVELKARTKAGGGGEEEAPPPPAPHLEGSCGAVGTKVRQPALRIGELHPLGLSPSSQPVRIPLWCFPTPRQTSTSPTPVTSGWLSSSATLP